jgi:multimeric flavodoxin WrbA
VKILGIVGSCRRLGNTEILVKEALMAAQEEGAEVDIVRWTDYNILPCEGDALCMFMGRDCKHKDKDGHDYLLNMMYEFDGVVFGAPCYILEVEAVVKQFIDRLFIMNAKPSKMVGKPAAVIVPYATRGWTSYAFLQPTIVLHFLGMDIIDKQLIHIQAMSETAGDSLAQEKARRIGKEVVHAVKTGDHSYKGEPGICPVCHERNIRIMGDNETIECGICAIRGKLSIVDGKIKADFPQDQYKWHRFAVESLYRHSTYEIKPSKDYFTRKWPELKEQRRKYKEYLDIDRGAREVK